MQPIQSLRLSVITLTMLCISTAALAAGIYSGGTGENETPFLISDANDILEMRDHDEDWDKSFKLTNDIDLDAHTFTKAVIAWDASSESKFQGTIFTGNIDGQGHSITHLTINVGGTTGKGYLGFIGYGQNCTIKNLSLESALVTANASSWTCAIMAARLNNAIIQGCTVTGIINSDTGQVGGLIGRNESGDISQCISNVTVNGIAYLGGLVGSNQDSNITQCRAGGPVNGLSCVGGLIGQNYTSTVTQCYANGDVTASDIFVGGLSGENVSCTFIHCYSTGSVTGARNRGGLLGSNSGYGIVHKSYWDTDTSGYYVSAGGEGRTTAQMQQSANYWGWSGWTISEGTDYPHLAWEDTEGTPITFDRNYPGNGTPQNPYRISTRDQLETFFLAMDDWDSHVTLQADIDFGLTLPDRIHTNRLISDFSGVFDGTGHTISNQIIDTTSNFAGLFRKITESGIVQNLNLDAFEITAEKYVGSLAGYNKGSIHHCHAVGIVNGLYYDYTNDIGGIVGCNTGTIHHCSASVEISGHRLSYNVGGLVGTNQGTVYLCSASGPIDGQWEVGGLVGTNSGTIERSYATGSVVGCFDSYHIGGLIGLNNGSIRQCYTTASVDAYSILGGLVGINNKNGTIDQSYATGSVIGTTSYHTGGLVARNHGQIRQCYATGLVSGPNNNAGLVSDLYGDEALIENSFWDVTTTQMTVGYIQSESSPGTVNNVTGLTTEYMQQKTDFLSVGWDFVNDDTNGTDDVWRLCIDGTGYPQLAWVFAQAGDLTCPAGCQLDDLDYLANDWLLEISDDALMLSDINGDRKVNQQDFLILANYWMTE